MEKVFVPIYLFAQCIGYCQVIINHFYLGIKPRFSKEKYIGGVVHRSLKRVDDLIPKKKLSGEELKDPSIDFDTPREEFKVKIERETPFVYLGRLDKIIRKGGNVYVIDDKIQTQPLKQNQTIYPDRLAQLSSYCEGFVRSYPDIAYDKIFLKVVRRDDKGNPLSEFEKEYNEELQSQLLDNFEIFESVYSKKAEPLHCGSSGKCRMCGYNYKCSYKLW